MHQIPVRDLYSLASNFRGAPAETEGLLRTRQRLPAGT